MKLKSGYFCLLFRVFQENAWITNKFLFARRIHSKIVPVFGEVGEKRGEVMRELQIVVCRQKTADDSLVEKIR